MSSYLDIENTARPTHAHTHTHTQGQTDSCGIREDTHTHTASGQAFFLCQGWNSCQKKPDGGRTGRKRGIAAYKACIDEGMILARKREKL